jgi:hypothetical protein
MAVSLVCRLFGRSHIAIPVFLCSAIVCSPVWAQRPPVTATTTESWFDESVGIENSGLINGIQYKMKFRGTKTTPFLADGEFQGTVQVDDELYAASLMYDTYLDVPVLKHLTQSGLVWFIQLDKKNVKHFTLRDRTFELRDGMYIEVLFKSRNLEVFSRRSKVEVVNKSVSNYKVFDRYFTIRKNQKRKLSKVSDLAKLFDNPADQSKIKTFIKSNRIRKRKFKDEDLIKVAAYANTLYQNDIAR